MLYKWAWKFLGTDLVLQIIQFFKSVSENLFLSSKNSQCLISIGTIFCEINERRYAFIRNFIICTWIGFVNFNFCSESSSQTFTLIRRQKKVPLTLSLLSFGNFSCLFFLGKVFSTEMDFRSLSTNNCPPLSVNKYVVWSCEKLENFEAIFMVNNFLNSNAHDPFIGIF